MKAEVQQLISHALQYLVAHGQIPGDACPKPLVERTRNNDHGDFACNIAMVMAKNLRKPPRKLAEAIVAAIPASPLLDKVEIAGPGFINFYLQPSAYLQLIPKILAAGNTYGRSELGAGKRIQVEFVSANPTGPLHVGHGRSAAYGSVLAELLAAVGFSVHREYYVNDAGRQMDILATSVWLRYLELCGEQLTFPTNGYKGDYIWDIAATLHRSEKDQYRHPQNIVFAELPADAPFGDKERFIDALITRAKKLLGVNGYQTIFDLSLSVIVTDIRADLQQFGVNYDTWYSERSLIANDAVVRCLEKLRSSEYVYERDGAMWFRSTALGDEKDRVVVRENGQTTYFASDIAYHLDKIERGFDKIIDIWGADHHGYVPRVKAALQALGVDPQRLEVKLVQFAILYKGGERAQMSTRSGEFVTLRELRQEVGRDAARFFYVMRSCDQGLDFDLDLAKSQSTENPVYYIQYAYARIRSIFRQAYDKGMMVELDPITVVLERLVESQEQEVLRTLSRYPEVVESAALQYEPHQLTSYLRVLANDFHVYYNAHPFLVTDAKLRKARLGLVRACEIVLQNGLGLLGVGTPESM